MSEQLKFILTEINSTFRTNYDLIKFDALNEVQLLQILMDLLAHYEAGPKIEVKETEPDVMSLQLFEMLRNVKYKPPSGVDPQVFRKDILTGDRATVLSVLQWLLKNKERAVNTAYLARYLTRPNVPPEIMNTTSMKDLSEAYDKLIEEFKEVHKRTKSMPKDNGSEVINDIKEMAVERDIVIKRLEATQLNLFDVSDKEELLQVSKTLRQQQERSVELNEQLTDQQNLTKKTSDQLQRYLNSFHGQMSSLKTPDELILKLTEDLQLNEYLVKEKMPDQLISARRILSVMQAAQNEPITTRQQLLSVQEKVDAVNREIESLMQKKMANIDPQEDKLTPFRQQAAAIRRNKHALADKLQELTTTLHHSEAHLADKQAQVHQLLGDAVLRGEELKKYVTKLRNKSSVYKRQRAALSSLKVEVGVLTRTLDILSIADPTVEMALVNHKKLNIDLDSNEDDNKNTPELEKKSVHDLSQMVAKLTQSLSEVNEELKPLATKLMPIRNEHQTLQQQYEQKKRVYDSTSINLTSQMEPLETQVKELSQTITRKEEEWKHLRQQISKAEGLRETVESESRIQHSELQSPRRPSRMESLLRQLATLETQVASLREDQKSISERQSVVDEQAEMWDNLLKLLQCKIKCKEKSNKKQGYMTITNQTQTFTLQSD